MAELPRGRFITLEGGEGSGKSTLIEALSSKLTSIGVDHILTREPGGTPLAEALRSVLLNPAPGGSWSAVAEALIVNAARLDHLDKVIRPALEQGRWVLCDRFMDSTRVYQGIVGKVPAGLIGTLEAEVIQTTRPDLTLILDAPLSLTAGRRTGRNATDAFESRGAEFHEAVRSGFLDIAQQEQRRCVLLDATLSPEAVAERAWQTIESRLLGSSSEAAS
jgi:dTMP kinase